MPFEVRCELTKQTYQDTLDLWGEWDEDAPQHFKEYSKASRDHERLSKAIKRDTPNVDGWELLDQETEPKEPPVYSSSPLVDFRYSQHIKS